MKIYKDTEQPNGDYVLVSDISINQDHKVRNFTFTYKNQLYDRKDIEIMIDSDELISATLERYRTEYVRAKQEVEELKDQIAILTHRKP